MRVAHLIILACFLFAFSGAPAQKFTAGIHLNPIFRYRFFTPDLIDLTSGAVHFSVVPRTGFAGGMLIRMNLALKFSAEWGINYVRRNYRLTVSDSSSVNHSDFGIIAYEIPLWSMVFIRLSDAIYMDAYGGVSLHFPVKSTGDESPYYTYRLARPVWLNAALEAGAGSEYRTGRRGSLYFGASYHHPFSAIILMSVEYDFNGSKESVNAKLTGNYFTIDFRYYFRPGPEKSGRT